MRYVLLIPVGALTNLTLGIGLGGITDPDFAGKGSISALPFGVIGLGVCIWLVWPWMMGNDNE
jgi:hypothetical protein